MCNRMRVINYQPSYPTDSHRRGNAEQLKIPVGLKRVCVNVRGCRVKAAACERKIGNLKFKFKFKINQLKLKIERMIPDLIY